MCRVFRQRPKRKWGRSQINSSRSCYPVKRSRLQLTMKNCAALLAIVGVWTHVDYNPGCALVEDSFSLLTMVTKKQKFEQIWRTYLIFSLKILVFPLRFFWKTLKLPYPVPEEACSPSKRTSTSLLEPFLNSDADWQRYTVNNLYILIKL